MADKYNLTFVWPHHEPNDVIVTGDFDGWNSTVHLKRSDRGFEVIVPVDWDSKIRFKFRTDGWWTTIANYPTEVDDLGNVNNVTFTPVKPPVRVPDPVIPEEAPVEKELPPTSTVEDAPAPINVEPTPDVVQNKQEEREEPVAEVTPVAPAPEVNESEQVVDKVEAPVDETPDVPAAVLPIAEKEETVDAAPELKVEESSAKDIEPASIDTTTDTTVAAPSTVATEPEPVKEQPSTVPISAERPSTPPPKEVSLPSTPVKANSIPVSVPSTPSSSQTMPVPASAPATPAGKMPFPSEGKDDGRTIQSKKESGKGGKEAKRRVSFMDKIKAKFGSPTKEKDKESGKKLSVFHKRSSSRI